MVITVVMFSLVIFIYFLLSEIMMLHLICEIVHEEKLMFRVNC